VGLEVSRSAFLAGLAALAFAAASPAADTEPAHAMLVQAGADWDADDFGGWLTRAGALFAYRSHLDYAGIAAQNTHYSQDGWSKDVAGVMGVYRRQNAATLAGVRAEAGVVSVSGHARVVGDATWSHRIGDKTGVELIAAGDVVGTREALDRGIAFGLAAASLERQFGERVTAIGLAGWQPFTDGNSRAHLRARLIWSLAPEQGVSAQARWRQYSSSDEDVDGAYFNPDRYRNWDAGLSIRRRVGGWTVAGLAGGGQEKIDDGSWKSTTLAEVRAEGPVGGKVRLAFEARYQRAAGFAQDPDYWYGSAGVQVIVPFGR
jgi:hypothetical protein